MSLDCINNTVILKYYAIKFIGREIYMENKKVELKERKDIPKEYTWDLESMYKDIESWERDMEEVGKRAEEYTKYEGKVGESAETLLNALKDRDAIYRTASNVYSYANMRLDQDTRVGESQALLDRALAVYVKVQESTSFLIPEILQIDEES